MEANWPSILVVSNGSIDVPSAFEGRLIAVPLKYAYLADGDVLGFWCSADPAEPSSRPPIGSGVAVGNPMFLMNSIRTTEVFPKFFARSWKNG
jgi:hypothetical protein